MPFRCQKMDIPEVLLIEPAVFPDERGYFAEIVKATDFRRFGIAKDIVQVNHSHSIQGVLRGLHYQKSPKAQGKLVSVIEGEVFDVAVDVRKGSPTFGRWLGMNLDAEKKKMLYVPEGFAHGFCALTPTAQVIYYCTEIYSPPEERGIRWDDPALGISWPLQKPLLSKKDSDLPFLKNADNNFHYAEK
ncbi:MAG: dTDP-4-dehydrorhamnose 3,5-epimerase [Candidatus Omnitrophota bacterium]|nr:dTDP-4-dehydrorhamnose 3,5-epimerase [Candidatus Omnitrophota bacterium]